MKGLQVYFYPGHWEDTWQRYFISGAWEIVDKHRCVVCEVGHYHWNMLEDIINWEVYMFAKLLFM